MFKVGLIGTLALSSFYTLCQYSDYFKGNMLFRLGRTFFTVSSMTVDYKIFYLTSSINDLNYDLLLSKVHQKASEKLLNLSLSNGGCYIKIGQHLGSLTYLLPDEYVNTLKVLHDNVPNESYENIYQLIKEEIGIEPSVLFSEISYLPIGTASLAQVHYGKLNCSNLEVAIKVQHRNVRDHSSIDLLCMDVLFSCISTLFPEMNLNWLAEETRKNLPRELNFLMEAENAEDLRQRFKNKLSFLKIPDIYWNYSTDKLLVMEYCRGGKITDRTYIEANGLSAKQISRNLCRLYSEMIFVEGFVHSDPHPGNIIVRQAKSLKNNWLIRLFRRISLTPSKTCEIVLLDHGLYQNLSDDFLAHYCRLWLHIINKNEEGMKQEGLALGCKKDLHRLLACMVSGRSWSALEQGISNTEFSLKEGQFMRSSANRFFKDMIDILNSVPREMLLVLKTNDLLRGVEHSLMGTPYNSASLGIIIMTSYCASRTYYENIRAGSETKLRIVHMFHSWISLIIVYMYFANLYLWSLFS